ncbi:MAG: TIGR01841 family phasin [Sphingomonas sp.]
MASKGPKTGTAKPAAPKPAAQPKKPAAPKAKIVAPAVEKPAPEPVVETIVPAAAAEPVPSVEAAPQEVIETVEAVAEPVVEAVTETATSAAAETVVAPAVKETVKMATIENTVENNTAKAQAFFADFNDRTKAAVEKSTKLVEEANEFAKGNVEALVESGRIAAKGFESFGQEAAEYSRKSFESATAALKTLATVKSPADFFKLQSEFVRGAFDSYVAEASKTTEAMLKLAGDAAQPLSNRVAVAAEKVKTAA